MEHLLFQSFSNKLIDRDRLVISGSICLCGKSTLEKFNPIYPETFPKPVLSAIEV
jgi:hypothetical protein